MPTGMDKAIKDAVEYLVVTADHILEATGERDVQAWGFPLEGPNLAKPQILAK